MHETLQEFIDSRGLSLRVDREAGVIRGVKILGQESRNGRVYPAATLAAAVGLYEGAKVNVNHPKGDPAAPRDYQDRIGVVRNVVVRVPDGLFGDLHFNAKHALAEQLAWDAIHAPQNVGFSHNVQARTARRGDHVIVEAILKVNSVDLVADPATTQGLFEAAPQAKVPDTVESPELIESVAARQATEIVALREEIQRLHAAENQRQKLGVARRIMAEFGLPDPDSADDRTRPLLGEAFLESLLATADDAAMRRLIEERAQLLATARAWPLSRTWPQSRAAPTGLPLARDQQLVESGGSEMRDVRGFVRAIT